VATVTTAHPRFLRRPEARPDELLTAAGARVGGRGLRPTTPEEVATRAGVSKGTVYLYFASKDDLFRAVVEHNVIALLEPAEAMARAHAGSASELLTKVVHRMWAALSQRDMVCLSRLAQAELTQFPEVRRFFFDNVILRHRRLLHGIATRGVASGEFRREATTIISRMVPALVMQLNQFRFLFGDLDATAPTPEKMRDAMLLMVLEGVRKSPVRPRARAKAGRRRTKRGS
jgi:AcrR family transcriptional regulator